MTRDVNNIIKNLPVSRRRKIRKRAAVLFTAEQIEAKIARGEDRTDWRKADAVVGKKLARSIRADTDDVHEKPDWAKAVKGIPDRKR